MGIPYTSVTVADYNLNPPPDDGSQTPANEITWAKHKSKLADPLKTAIESINTNVGNAINKLAGGVTAVSDDYQVLATDQGKLVAQLGSSKTITTPEAATVDAPFRFGVVNLSATDLALDGSGSETVDGSASITIPAGKGVLVETDGTNWFTYGQNWEDFDDTFEPLGKLRDINRQTGDYTLALTDAGKTVEINSESSEVVTIPTNASVAFPIGTYINIVRYGPGAVTITADTGVTLNGVSAGSGGIADQFGGITLYKRGENEWVAPNFGVA